MNRLIKIIILVFIKLEIKINNYKKYKYFILKYVFVRISCLWSFDAS